MRRADKSCQTVGFADERSELAFDAIWLSCFDGRSGKADRKGERLWQLEARSKGPGGMKLEIIREGQQESSQKNRSAEQHAFLGGKARLKYFRGRLEG